MFKLLRTHIKEVRYPNRPKRRWRQYFYSIKYAKAISLRSYLNIISAYKEVKSFIAKRVISILVNFRYLRFKLLKYKENNKNISDTFDHNFRYIPLCIMS